MRIKVLRNVGDNEEMRGLLGNDIRKYREGVVLDAPDKVARALMDHKAPNGRPAPLVEETDEELTDLDAPRQLRGVPAAPDLKGVPEESEVAGDTVPVATDKISRMRDPDKVRHIATTDTREGVKKAAERRFEELSK